MAEAYRLAKEKMEQAKAGGADSGSEEEPVERPREPAQQQGGRLVRCGLVSQLASVASRMLVTYMPASPAARLPAML